MEHIESGHIEKLPLETRDGIHKKIQSLRDELGDSFDVEETADEYIVTQGERNTRIAKLAEVLHKTPDAGAPEKTREGYIWPLKDLIEAQIRFPELEDSGKQMEKLKEMRKIKESSK